MERVNFVHKGFPQGVLCGRVLWMVPYGISFGYFCEINDTIFANIVVGFKHLHQVKTRERFSFCKFERVLFLIDSDSLISKWLLGPSLTICDHMTWT